MSDPIPMADDDETTAAVLPPDLTPERRRRGEHPDGIDVVLADQATWVLAHAGIAPVLTEIRDRVYDRITISGKAQMSDILQAAWVCLVANYHLSDDEVAWLLIGADEAALADATVDALLGPDDPRRTFTGWVLSAFHANGIDPADVPAEMIPLVMRQLEMTGRAAPRSEFIQSDAAARKRSQILDFAARRKERG